MYSYVKDNEKGGRTAKGIKKNVIKNNIKHIGLYTSGQDIDPFYFPKYRPPYFWTRYRSFFNFQNIGLHTSGQDMTYSSEVHDNGDPFSKL